MNKIKKSKMKLKKSSKSQVSKTKLMYIMVTIMVKKKEITQTNKQSWNIIIKLQ